MFTNDINKEKIDGESYLTFQPNTIVYATPVDSELGRQISKAKIGIVFHTTYTGKSLPEMKASFGANISSLKKPTSVWMDDATYKDVSGKATFTKSETDAVTAKLSLAGSIFRRINATLLEKFIRLQGAMTGNLSGASFKTYLNTFVRKGLVVKDVKGATVGYLKHVDNHFTKMKDKVKTSGAKGKIERNQKEYLREFAKHTRNLENVISFQNSLVAAKQLIINKLNSVKSIGTFIKTDKGYKVSNPEGYVAIDSGGGAVKLVDRMEFSYNNFTAVKAWDK